MQSIISPRYSVNKQSDTQYMYNRMPFAHENIKHGTDVSVVT